MKTNTELVALETYHGQTAVYINVNGMWRSYRVSTQPTEKEINIIVQKVAAKNWISSESIAKIRGMANE